MAGINVFCCRDFSHGELSISCIMYGRCTKCTLCKVYAVQSVRCTKCTLCLGYSLSSCHCLQFMAFISGFQAALIQILFSVLAYFPLVWTWYCELFDTNYTEQVKPLSTAAAAVNSRLHSTQLFTTLKSLSLYLYN